MSNPSIVQARIIVDELICDGVTDAVLCPGSRNGPLAFALGEADHQHRLRLHVRIDERSAAYLAVGLAIGSGSPTCIVMTSGTAVANVGPAVVEANYARVPLIILSANRPYELLGTGANQTIEQFGYFGTQLRATISMGLAPQRLDQLTTLNGAWRSTVCRAVAAAQGLRTANAGPVQLDIPLREPLVPDQSDQLTYPQGRAHGGPWTYNPDVCFDQPLDVDLNPDTIVIAGHGAGHYPQLAGLPTVAEPTASPVENPLHPFALTHLIPEQIIMVGRPTLHREVSNMLANPQVRVYALTSGPRWPDVSGNCFAAGTTVRVHGQPRQAWIDHCQRLHQRIDTHVHHQLDQHEYPTGLHVARSVISALRRGDYLFLGASNPVRDVALVGGIPAGVSVGSNRGAAGIDGTVSTAIGAALGHERICPQGRSFALVGDLSFVHDASGLLIGPEEPQAQNLTIVVANDDGGGIFSLLEQGDPRFGSIAPRLFGTPHGTQIIPLCQAYHIPATQVVYEDLAGILHQPWQGIRVVEVPTDRLSRRQLHESLRILP